jgi:ABC-type antimicrobial peptide transport system permease subunit
VPDHEIKDKNGNYKQLKLLPFKDVSFASFGKGVAKVDKTLTYLIFGVALLILIIACVNFTNMSIAGSTRRLKEFGMRKTLGAPKKQLFLQLWTESLIIFLVSIGIGLLLSVLFLDSFKTIFNTNISFEDFSSLQIVMGFMAMVLLITFISGGYPALLMTRIGTIQALKGKLNMEKKPHLRNALITVQFGISILLISGTLVLWKQLDYMRSKDLGYNKEHVISFPLNGKKSSYEAVQLLRNELQGNPNILSVSASDNNLGRGKDGSAYTSILGFDYKGRGVKTNMLVVDHDYIKTLDLKLVTGRGFDRKFAADSLSLVINETMAKSLNEENPLAINIMMDDSVNYKVIGVLKDYHFEKLNKSIAPITLFMNKEWDMYYAYVKVVPKNISASFDSVKNAYARVEPNAPFLGSFLNENVDRTFRRERALTTMITSGSCIAIVLSCIGLFAMSLLVVTQRTKEIGIRKVIGANILSITYLLAKDFLKLVLVGFLIASPLAWWLSKSWLEDYAYRTSLSVWLLLVPGVIAFFIALLTISAKTLNAALQNPTKSLRTE